MEDATERPDELATQSKSSEAIAEVLLLIAMSWVLFYLIQASSVMPIFQVQPYGAKWFVASFVLGVVPTLLVLIVVLLLSWLIGALRARANLWRSYRHALVTSFVFTLLINFGIWFGQNHR